MKKRTSCYSKKDKKLHEAFIVLAEENVDYLSYKGQTKWNQLAKRYETRKRRK